MPKILVGNRCHLAYKRQVSEVDAEAYALKSDMAFFEVSPLCDFNVMESMAELSRVALKRNGMSRTWGPNKGLAQVVLLLMWKNNWLMFWRDFLDLKQKALPETTTWFEGLFVFFFFWQC